MSRKYLRLASNRLAPDSGGRYVYPYVIAVSVDGDNPVVSIGEGDGHGSAGGVFTPAEALESQWVKLFTAAGGEWLRPYLRRLADGEKLGAEELVAEFTRLHGFAPEIFFSHY